MGQSIEQIVTAVANEQGFRRSGSHYYKDFVQVLHVIGLQRSRWAESFYLNAGVWMKSLGDKEKPKFNECHMVLRFDSLPSSPFPSSLEAALDAEDSWKMDSETRLNIVRDAFAYVNEVFLKHVTTVDDVRGFLSRNPLPVLAVKQELRRFAGLP